MSWGDREQREAHRRTYELAAEMIGTDSAAPSTGNPQRGQCLLADTAAAYAFGSTRTEATWRSTLKSLLFSPERIDREVRRVRAIAEGRLVREPERIVYQLRNRHGMVLREVGLRAEVAVWTGTLGTTGDTVRRLRVKRIRRPA